MPQLPDIEQRRSAQAAGLGPGPTGDTGVAQLGEALHQVGRTLQAAKVKEIEQSYELADATARSLSDLQAFADALVSDEDYASHGQKFVEHAREIEAGYKDSFSSPLAFKVWRNDFRAAASRGELAVAVQAEKLKTQRVKTDLGATLLSLSNLIGVNEEQDRIVRARARLAIEQNADAGNLSYDEKAQLIRTFDENAAETSIRRDMIADPAMAERKLAAGAYPELSGEQAAIWAQRVSSAAEAAERRQIAEEQRLQRAAEHELVLAGQEAAKSGDRLLANDQLNADWIEANRDVLAEDDYRYFYKQITDPPGETSRPANVEAYANLRERAGSGEDVRQEARQLLFGGDIRVQDYEKLLGEVEAERPGWRSLGTQYLATISGYSDINPTPGAAQLKAAMLDEWGQWADGHPNATPDEARKMYLAIGESHQLADEAVKRLTYPWPTYGVGSRQTIDLAETARRTRAAHDAGEISDDEYQRQAQIWQQWADLAKENQQ